MAIFGKDRERVERTRPGAFEGPASSGGAAPLVEGEMLERDKVRTSSDDGSASSAFLGKGTRIVGKLFFEGPARIEGTVEGEVTAQDTLTVGESAVVSAQVTGSTVVIHEGVVYEGQCSTGADARAPERAERKVAIVFPQNDRAEDAPRTAELAK